jgi:putative membrane protein
MRQNENMLGLASRILLRLLILVAGITLAAYLVPGIIIAGWAPVIKAAILLGLLNISIRPLLLLLTLPINLITLGLFTLVINGFILWLVGHAIAGFAVSGFLTAIAGSIVISLLSIVLGRFL